MRKSVILPCLALLGFIASDLAGQIPACGAFQVVVTGADTRELRGTAATVYAQTQPRHTLLDLRAAVPGGAADSVLVFSFSRHALLSAAAGRSAVDDQSAARETFTASYLRVRRGGTIQSYEGHEGTVNLSAPDDGVVRGDFAFVARGHLQVDSTAEVRVRGWFTAALKGREDACGRAAALAGTLPSASAFTPPPTAAAAPRRPPLPGEAPFGLRMGMTLADLVRFNVTPRNMRLGVYQLGRVPQPDARFRDYLVMVSLTEGLCRVTALTRGIPAGGDGAAVKDAFARMEASLRGAYGTGRRMDFLKEESTLSGPRQWMAALHRKERVLSVFWFPQLGSTFPPEMYGIELEASATSATSGYVAVHYEFSNFPTCQREARERGVVP